MVLHQQDGGSLVAGTSEGTVVQFQLLSSNVDQENKDWVRTRTFKNHSHDVRALVHLESAVVSGGESAVVTSGGGDHTCLTCAWPLQVWTPSWWCAPCWTRWRRTPGSPPSGRWRSHT